MIELNPTIKEEIEKSNKKFENNLSKFAFKSKNSCTYGNRTEYIRPVFFHDTDRIIHSRCYSRYIDKTQVFYLVENDHITHRVLHVQLVSKIARTIGRFLCLNEDLIEAIALGHDVGHTPFGHNGEKIVSEFCKRNHVGIFEHNVQSFRLLHELENKCSGVDLSVQVLDGIICHNGEMLSEVYEFDKTKTKEKLLEEYHESMMKEGVSKRMIPMTLEGCVVRISDVIAYVGRDIEDAEILELIKNSDIPDDITSVLGNSNKDIINNLILDLVNNSYGKKHLRFSQKVFGALDQLKKWNYKNIYDNPKKKTQDDKIERMFNYVLNRYLNDLKSENRNSKIYQWIDSEMGEDYLQKNDPARIVADYVSGMTDDFLMNSYKELVIPASFGSGFGNDCSSFNLPS